MSHYAQYSQLRDSGVDWLGSIPSHWDVLSARRLFKQIREPAKPDDEQLAATQQYGVIPQSQFVEQRDQKVVLALSGTSNFRHVETDDFVISLRSFQGGIERCFYRGCVSPAYTVMRPTKVIESEYFAYLLKSYSFISILQSVTQGIREGKTITYDQFGSILLPVPSIEEQRIIYSFLSYETAKIDQLIAKQERLIELLKEKRQAVISHAVTKGLNPNAPMKDSGVEWWGYIPKHWDMIKTKFLFDYVTSGSRGWAQYYKDDGHVFVRITNIRRDSIEPDVSDLQKVMLPEGAEGERSKIKKGDILITITADLGSICLANSDIHGGFINQHTALCRPSSKVVFSRWLAYTLIANPSKKQFESLGYGGTKTQLSLEDVKEILVPLPPVEEREDIYKYVDLKLTQFDQIIDKSRASIDLLKEHRSALIFAAVTGKVDVRDWKPESSTQSQRQAVIA